MAAAEHSDEQTDAEIIAAACDDPARFALLFDRHAPTIHRYLARRVGPSDADDLLADVFLAAFEARERFDTERASALPWLYGIAGNLSARTFRSRTRASAATARLVGHAPAPEEPEDSSDRIAASSGWPAIAAALDRIPDEQREALLLFAWEELSYEEIAEALDAPIGTVRSRISRAREKLRELLIDLREST